MASHEYLVFTLVSNSYMVGNCTTDSNGISESVEKVIIPNYWQGIPVTIIGDYAFRNNAKIKSIFIPSNIEKINFDAIAHMSNLASVIFAKNSSLKEVGRGFLYNCPLLKKVVIPNSLMITGIYTFGRSNFDDIYYCGFNHLNQTKMFETSEAATSYPKRFHVPLNYGFTSVGKFSNLTRDKACERYINGASCVRKCSSLRVSMLFVAFIFR